MIISEGIRQPEPKYKKNCKLFNYDDNFNLNNKSNHKLNNSFNYINTNINDDPISFKPEKLIKDKYYSDDELDLNIDNQ